MDQRLDSELAASALNGKTESFDALMRRHLPAVLGLARRYAGEQAAAEDIAQDSFLKAWRNLAAYDVTKKFRTWILTITRRTAIDHWRRRSTVPFSEFDTPDGRNILLETLADENYGAALSVAGAELALLIERTMPILSPGERALLDWRLRDGLPFEDMAAVIGEPLETVKSRYRRALLKLRRSLGGQDAPK